MNFVHIVALLAVAQFFFFGIMVGRARVKYDVHAPAMSGNEQFERVFRVHMNTLEQLAGFLPALLIAGVYWSNATVAGIGVVYLIGRFIYRQSYLGDPKKRGLGFLLTVAPTTILFLMGLIGAVRGA